MAELLKNLYSADFIAALGSELKNANPSFDLKKFQASVLFPGWKNLELKNRMHHVTEMMHAHLPGEYSTQLKTLDKVAPKFTGLTAMIFPNFVERYGLAHYHKSLDALAFYTQFSTSEFAIRPFLKANPSTIEVLYEWAKDKNHHVRRLASEGCRPLLPWGMKLEQYVKDPQPILPIITRLKNDKEDYVYRSVANNLNDISKHHPALVLDLAGKWINKTNTTDWVLKHALRTLLKRGDAKSMKLFGFSPTLNLSADKFEIAKSILKIGESTLLHFQFTNHGKAAKMRFEYLVSYLKKNGSYTHKVFHISEKQMSAGETQVFAKKLDFKDLSTRKHYKGPHYVTLKINGVEKNKLQLVLK